MKSVRFTIRGEAASKANSRRAVMLPAKGGGKRSALIKSEKALSYEKFAGIQIPADCQVMFDVPVRAIMKIYYCTERPDLDESLILDILQAQYKKHPKTGEKMMVRRGVYVNDRLVREKFIFHGIDKHNPRTEIIIEPIETAVQQALDIPEPDLADYAHGQASRILQDIGLGPFGRRDFCKG